MTSKAFRIDIGSKGIARLIFDLPDEKVNKFSSSVMDELEILLDKMSQDSSIQILVIESGKKNIFIAGADIKELEVITDSDDALNKSIKGQEVFNKLANLPFPTVAVIDGACLGGGLEFALACTYRLVTDNKKTVLGFPEVNLGILPGWGGTQRLPRLIGLMSCLPLVLGGRPVKARKAYKIKMADSIIAAEFKEEKTADFIQKILTSEGKKQVRKRRKRKRLINLLFERNPIGRVLLFKKARKDIMRRSKGHYPAPLAILRLIKKTYNKNFYRGLKQEAYYFSELAITKISKNLISIFYISESLKKDAGEKEKCIPVDIHSAGLLGAGIMGGGIAWAFSNKDITVRMKDISWDAILKGFAAMNDYYKQLLKRRKLTPGQVNLKMHKVTGTTDYSGYGNLDLVVEAIVEDIDIKKKVFSELEENIGQKTVICSNTSTLSITEMGAVLQHPERFAGMHFFNPVNRMPLIEVIQGGKTSPQTIATIIALSRRLGKIPVVVQDSPGFLVNRILIPYMIESTIMLQEGAELKRIDTLIEKFGMPMGPFILADEIGIDVCYKVSMIMADSLDLDKKGIDILRVIYEEGHLTGKKGKKGFYLYEGKKKTVNNDVSKWVKSAQKRLGISGRDLPDKDILNRLIMTMINEASKCLVEKVIERPDYLDMALILGTGFPPFRGGLLRYADDIGVARVVDTLKVLAEKYGERFNPCQMLLDMAGDKATFY